jgi:UDP-N-acetylglucosamine--N-acetylmuramyl-(pentapeptide) pyrophosphoryl-undecaprenol N-acetylglucosamine transferase
VRAARRQLQEVKAGLVLGVGGYISAPPVLAAWTLGIPRAVHEANVTPGLANRLCARVADLVFLTYEATAKRLPGKAPRHTVGCPVNPAILLGDAAAARSRYGLAGERPMVLVVGGSLGARTINQLGLSLARLPDRNFDLVLVTGPTYLEEVRGQLGKPPPGVAVVGYEDKMADAYAAASLVVCRAGSSTLAELTAVGLPSVLVPSPNVTDNHQEGNARGLETVGAARVVLEKGINLEQEAEEIGRLVADSSRLVSMGAAARGQARLGTAEAVAGLLGTLLAD